VQSFSLIVGGKGADQTQHSRPSKDVEQLSDIKYIL
jgi:hypothetical protein